MKEKQTTTAVLQTPVASSGIAGLDEILRGGFPVGHVYLIEGAPGSGKTTLSLQFAMEGVSQGEKVLYITLSETRADLVEAAATHGWSLEGVEVAEVLSFAELADERADSTMFHPSEVELGVTMRRIIAAVAETSPSRVVIDSLTELRLQSQSLLRYRREVLALRELFSRRSCTTLLLDELESEITAQSVVHGIIEMERNTPDFGPTRRRLQVAKLRGVHFREGYHDMIIRRGSIEVYPRLVAARHRHDGGLKNFASGPEALDRLTGGGIPFGSTTLLMGPAGSGKSSLATQIFVSAAKQEVKAAVFSFDETSTSFVARASGMGMELQEQIAAGRVRLEQVDPGQLSAGQFITNVRNAVEKDGTKVLVIDSLNGYLAAMGRQEYVITQLHELTTYLNQSGVLSLLVVSQSGIVNEIESPIDTTYLADNVLLFRPFEAGGELRRTISVLKKRSGQHEKTIRELLLTSSGIEIGQPLRGFQGILSGLPTYIGEKEDLLLKRK